MPLTSKIREQIINTFRAELSEHVQTLNDGLLVLEQNKISGKEREELLGNVFRAAHSLKGAARAVGVGAVEQLSHALEDVLGAMQHDEVELTAALFTACYRAIDAIQVVQAVYEAGETTPPQEALQALAELDPFRHHAAAPARPVAEKPAPPVEKAQAVPPPPPVEQAPPPPPVSAKKGAKAATDKLGQLFNDIGEDVKNTEHPTAPAAAEALPPPVPVETSQPKNTPVTPVVPPPPPPPPPTPPTPPSSTPDVPTPTAPTSQPTTGEETIRVSVTKLDALMAQLSELLVTKIRAEQRLAQVRQAQEYIALWQKEWMAERGGFSRLVRQNSTIVDGATLARQRKEVSRLFGYVNSSQNRLREMTALINNLSREYHSDTMQMSLVIDGLEEEIKRVRMLPLSTIVGSFGRMTRDLAQASGKEAVLEIIGGDVELDKRVLEQIKDPIMHLLRNAIDHGIEIPKKRLAAGKPACGRVTLTAEQQGKDIAISIADDGQGLNVDVIRQVAIRRGVSNAATLSDAELVDLIYNPGFSTSPIITDVSGRGVGLDVVRRNIETLRGRINVNWAPGEGTRFTLFIPLTLTSSRGLLVKVSKQLFAIPLNAIERIKYVRPEEVESVGGYDTLKYEGRPLMLVHLASVLGLPSTNNQRSEDRIPVVILSAVERRMAFAVDELADEQEVVIKGLGKQLTRVGGIAGASVLGNGEVVLILNIADLIKLTQRTERRSILDTLLRNEEEKAVNTNAKRHILVVDDSITTRTLEKNILEAAGYTIQLAVDGQEAYDLVSMGELPDLIISDVSMPRLDGCGLAQRVKNNPRTSNIPLILVTSLDSVEDKARGIESGADAYIVKSSFDQNNLLETIEQLI
jgi:two-component system chemotaxis sensor kinase CheA